MKEAQGIIYYEYGGVDGCWEISAHPDDTPETLKEHFCTYKFPPMLPTGAVFIGAEVWRIER